VDGARIFPSLWEGSVIPEVTLVGEAITDKANLSLLDVLLDRIEELLLGNLNAKPGR
jgi:hypothetical protein